MWRYFKEAFWARPLVPLAGALPLNALAVLGFGIIGCAEHAFWLIGAGLETAYLYTLATNPRFQRAVAARDLVGVRHTAEQTRHDLLAQLTPESRKRFDVLEGKIAAVANLYRTAESENLMLDSNMEAIRELGALALRLLAAECNLQAASRQVDEAALARLEAGLGRELADGGSTLSAALRDSKRATLELTQKRLHNARRRIENLAEIGSDLARIEAQVDLALEDAGLEGRPTAVAADVNLLNLILKSNSALGNQESFSSVPPPVPGASVIERQ